jgi:glycosyltransferase involved in cell wall biosynthesis/SAM-dependent methyltransferase
MIVHVFGLPHTQTNKRYTTCAFTQKALKLCAMLHRRGHTVYHYGAGGAEVEATEMVDVVTREEQEQHYPHPGTGFYKHDSPAGHEDYLKRWVENSKRELLKRIGEPNTEILSITWGAEQWQIAQGIPQFAVESGIGYPLAQAAYRVYESYAWLHMHLGRDGAWDGARWYWAVIPNAFDVKEFTFKPRSKRSDFFLFMGRLNTDKGVHMAIDIARQAGRRIVVCGPGDASQLAQYGPDTVTYLPPVGAEDRRILMSNCAAFLCPTFYVEPFCGVNVEAQLSGAPVIATDWGVFPETVLHGKTGYRFRTMEQAVWAAKNIHNINPEDCSHWAEQNFSLERVALMYEEFFQQVLNIGDGSDAKVQGFYAQNPGREQLGWLNKCYGAGDPDINLTVKFKPSGVPVTPGAISHEDWIPHQKWEADWWGLEDESSYDSPRWQDERGKQEEYARLMGLSFDPSGSVIYMPSKDILDVGCGPISLLSRVHLVRRGYLRGIDPLPMSEITLSRYRNCGVDVLHMKAEDMPLDVTFDEVWIYNCLQHTQDPHKILQKVAQLGRAVRVFEWIDIEGPHMGHPQKLTEAMFLKYFTDWKIKIWNTGFLRYDGYSTPKYIAFHVVKK